MRSRIGLAVVLAISACGDNGTPMKGALDAGEGPVPDDEESPPAEGGASETSDAGEAPPPDDESPPAGSIVYVSRRAGLDSLWIVGSDGKDPKQLTPGSAVESGPRWSPDGKRIAFARAEAGRLQVFTIAADGSDERQLTDDARDNYDPAWSPDGTQLVFVCELGAWNSDPRAKADSLCTISAHGGAKVVVPNPPDTRFYPIEDRFGPRSPDWSTTTDRLLFAFRDRPYRYGRTRVFSQRPDGAELTLRIDASDPSPMIESPRWAPDGERFVYAISGDSSDPKRFSLVISEAGAVFGDDAAPASDRHASWSKAGAALVFESDRTGTPQIYWTPIDVGTLPMAAENVHPITDDEFDNSQPDFHDAQP